VPRNAIVSLAEVTHDELDFVHHTPPACDPASQPQGPLQITAVESVPWSLTTPFSVTTVM
jgi:hypothetical protein